LHALKTNSCAFASSRIRVENRIRSFHHDELQSI
jgi:hypothetical protein